VDLNDTIYDVAADIVSEHKVSNAYDDFQVDVMRLFTVKPEITEEEFISSNVDNLAERLFDQVMAFYKKKSEQIAAQTLPVLQNVLEERGNVIENVVVPFNDGSRGLQVAMNLKKAVESNGREVFKSFEKGVVLALIDEAWKEHLREMDDLKQSVQNVVYEQK